MLTKKCKGLDITGRQVNLKRIETILISQPPPANGRSPYFNLEERYNIKVDFRSFIHLEEVPVKEFRRQRINPLDYSAVIFTSKNSIEHFFRICDEMRIKLSQDTRYFCISKAIAHYLQKFIVYRKRKVFYGKRTIEDLRDVLMKYKEERFLLPCSSLGRKDVANFLQKHDFNYSEALLYRTVASDLSDLENITYDMLVFFSPLGIKSLYENFPNFKQRETRIAAFGKSTQRAIKERELTVNIAAPLPEAPSMTRAIELYLQQSNR